MKSLASDPKLSFKLSFAEEEGALFDTVLSDDVRLLDELLENGGVPVAIDTTIHATMQITTIINTVFCKRRLTLSDISSSRMNRQSLSASGG